MAKKSKSAAPKPLSTLNPSLERLGVMAGDWEVEFSSMSFSPDPSAVARGRSSFEWLEGGAFMIERSEPPTPDFPRGTLIIGPDDAAGTYCTLYYDSRGVSRIYQMSLRDGTWKMWRDFSGFSQRFTGIFGEDSNTINARWEKSSDGLKWEHDFNLTYTRIKQA